MPFRFESLDIWHMARAYATRVYAVTAKFPRHEDYGLKSQQSRSTRCCMMKVSDRVRASTPFAAPCVNRQPFAIGHQLSAISQEAAWAS